MTASGNLHRATLGVLDTLGHDVAEVGREILLTDFDPIDVAVWLESEGHQREADFILRMAEQEEREVWGTTHLHEAAT